MSEELFTVEGSAEYLKEPLEKKPIEDPTE